MVHKRSGAQRRKAQRAACGTSDSSPAQRVPSRAKKPLLQPDVQEVIAAIMTLYADNLKPFGRILRKRVAERLIAITSTSPVADANLPDVDVDFLRSTCEACAELAVQPEEGGDFSVVVVGCPQNFVDTYGSEDVYPESLWESAASYFGSAKPEDVSLPGGRYSCAQILQARELPFLSGRSLGEICHIVQLAIAKRKLLGYLNGSVVPYYLSHSMKKDSAMQKQVCLATCQDAIGLPVATWPQVRDGIKRLLEEAACATGTSVPGILPISNLKVLFRTNFKLELSETTLGHPRLRDMLQDDRLADVCELKLESRGYSIVRSQGRAEAARSDNLADTAKDSASSSDGADEEGDQGKFEQTHALSPMTSDAFGFVETPGPFAVTPCRAPTTDAVSPMASSLWGYIETPGPFAVTPHVGPAVASSAQAPDYSCFLDLLQSSLQDASLRTVDTGNQGPRPFCMGEPLELDGMDGLSAPCFASTPTPYPLPDAWLRLSTQQEASACKSVSQCDPKVEIITGSFCPDEPLSGKDPADPQNAQIRIAPLPWNDGALEHMVQNTFIHVSLPPPTPEVGSIRRSMSLFDLRPPAPFSPAQIQATSCSEEFRHCSPSEPSAYVLRLADALAC